MLELAGHVLLVAALAVLSAWLINRLVQPLVRVAVREQMSGQPEIEVRKRIETLSDVLYRTSVTVIAIIAVVTVLPEFGISVGPLIAGLGLVGLAVGFGAQSAVKDLINGIEILLDNQYGRGDFVRLRTMTGGNIAGTVEDINLRRSMLRDQDGAVHFVAHGSIEVASNLTRGSSRVAFNVPVAYSEDVERVFQLIDQVGEELAADPVYGPLVREPPRAAGIERLGEATLEVRVDGIVLPGEQWRVGGELRRRLKRAFDAEGIRLRD